MIGSTDSHTGLATADEDNFFGKFSGERTQCRARIVGRKHWATSRRRGLAGIIWRVAMRRCGPQPIRATAIFDAMMRREVYATTGPRMAVRFFGGWDFSDADLKGDLAKAGYARGVPMGGDLKAGQGAPQLHAVGAQRPDGGQSRPRAGRQRLGRCLGQAAGKSL